MRSTLVFPIVLLGATLACSTQKEGAQPAPAQAPAAAQPGPAQPAEPVGQPAAGQPGEPAQAAPPPPPAPAAPRAPAPPRRDAAADRTPPPPSEEVARAPDVAREAAAAAPVQTPPAPQYRELTIPAGTLLPVRLETAVASDTSQVEDAVRAAIRRSVVIDETTVLPAGTVLHGSVTDVARSGKVKGRARLSMRFTSLVVDEERLDVQTATIAREAKPTTSKDAKKVGIPAAGGAIIGAIAGGGKGAAIGAAVGGGAGTAVVMGTRGEEVRLAEGTEIGVRLTEPLTVRVRVDGR